MPADLSETQRITLANLRQQPQFQALMRELPRTSLRPWVAARSSDEQEKAYIYQSGIIEGEKRLIALLLETPLGRSV